MKKVFIIGIFVVLSAALFSQESGIPFKKCNTIIVKNTTVKQFSNFILSDGFTIASYDKEFNSLESHPFRLWKTSGHTGIIIAFQKGDDLLITGNSMVTSFSGGATMKMEKRSTGNMAGKLFSIINQEAVKYAGENKLQISYIVL